MSEKRILDLIPKELHETLFKEVVETLESKGELPKGTAYPNVKPAQQEVSQDMKDYLAEKRISNK